MKMKEWRRFKKEFTREELLPVGLMRVVRNRTRYKKRYQE